MKPKQSQEVRKGKTEQDRRLQGEAYLKSLHGKILTGDAVDLLYQNWFAIREMTAGRLKIQNVVGSYDLLITYSPPIVIDELSETMIPNVKEE